MSDTDRRDILDAAAALASLVDVLARLRRGLELDLCVSAPGTLATYDPVTQTGSVLLGFRSVPATEYVPGPRITDPPMVIPNVRVSQVKGATHFDHAPLAVGDTGLLVFADRCLDEWYNAPPAKRLPPSSSGSVDPLDGRTHNLADAVFIPGISPVGVNVPVITNPTARTIDAPTIQLGAAAVAGVDNVAIAQALHTYLLAMFTAAGTAPLDGGVTFKAALIAYLGANPFTSFAATKVLAE